MKWTIINQRKFTGHQDDYSAVVTGSGGIWRWELYKDDKVIDVCYNHSIPTSELDAKVKTERALNIIINNQKTEA